MKISNQSNKFQKTTLGHKFRISSGFKQYNVVLTKEQSILTKIMSSLEGKNIQTQ